MPTFELLDINKPRCTNRRTRLSGSINNFIHLMKLITLAVKLICSVLQLDHPSIFPAASFMCYAKKATENSRIFGLLDSDGVRLYDTPYDHNPVTRTLLQTRLPPSGSWAQND